MSTDKDTDIYMHSALVALRSRHLRSIFWESISVAGSTLYLWLSYEFEGYRVEPKLLFVDALVPPVIEDDADLRVIGK